MTALKSIRWRKPTPEKPPEPPVVDLDKLETALNETSRRAAAQWLGFLSLWAYLFFTTVAVTDYDLLVETPVKLPLIGVELGLFSFFVWTPALFLVVHLYIARKVALLARQAAFYRKQILAQKVAGAHLAARENRLDAFAVTGLLLRFDGGEDQPPDRLLTGFTALTVYVTLFVLPLALYAAFLVYFLAYQHEFTTWWHRVALLLGAGLAVYGAFRAGALTLRRWVAGLSVLLIALVVSPAFVVFTFPGERLHEYSFAEQVFNVAGVYPNRLKPRQPAHLFAEMKKAGKLDEANQLDLAGRDFSGRTLRNTDLSGANLRGARFNSTDMQGADFSSAYLQGASLIRADLQGANLSIARLQSAKLKLANLQNAILSFSHLQGADLSNASLQSAVMMGAYLQGADLSAARLQGGALRFAGLQGADMGVAEMRGADLHGASLQGADLVGVHLQGANLREANLQGADLGAASLQGAYLVSASLQGADLSAANLQGANLDKAILWRTIFDGSDLTAIFANSIIFDLAKPEKNKIDKLLEEIQDEKYRKNAKEKLENIYLIDEELDAVDNMNTVSVFYDFTKDTTPYIRADVISYAICQIEDIYENDGHFTFQSIIHNRFAYHLSFTDLSAATLQAHIQNVENCPAARGLTDNDKKQLAKAVARQHQDWLRAEAAEWFARAGLGAGAAL